MEFKAPPVKDPKLKAILDQANTAADTFLNAVADMQEHMSFKAFTIGGGLTREQKNSVLDLIMTQVAIRIKEMGPEVKMVTSEGGAVTSEPKLSIASRGR